MSCGDVGNLVGPALFDPDEQMKAAILSVTECKDKPLKNPQATKVVVPNRNAVAANTPGSVGSTSSPRTGSITVTKYRS